MQPAAELQVPLPVQRPRQLRVQALRPGRSAVRCGNHDDRRGRASAVRHPGGDRLPGPRPVPDRHAVPAGQAMAAVGAAEAVEPQGAGDPRRWLRHRLRIRDGAQRHQGLGAVLGAAGRHPATGRAPDRRLAAGGVVARVRGDVHGAEQHRPQLQPGGQRRVDDDGEGAAGRAVRRDPLHPAPVARSPSRRSPTPTRASTRA